eukprot:c32105_g1_i1.p1 GENE.c32105_g1_i1~~c32105_g1_i1.p1  ORF type:complete len:280 (+),score=59.91 c32105_g1_i1:1-840(+)
MGITQPNQMLCLRTRSTNPSATHRGYNLPEWCVDEREKKMLLHVRALKEFDNLSDEEVVRFLQTRNYNKRKTITALKGHLHWQEKYNPSTILMDFVMNPLSTGLLRIIGCDKKGRPIVWWQSEFFNVTAFTADEFVLLLTWTFQQAKYMMRDGANQIIYLADMGHWRPAHLLYPKHSTAAMNTIENHFPGFMANMIVVRLNKYYLQVANLMSGWSNEHTNQVIQTIPDSELTERLLGIMDADILPQVYGGKARPPCPNIPGIENISEKSIQDAPTMALD